MAVGGIGVGELVGLSVVGFGLGVGDCIVTVPVGALFASSIPGKENNLHDNNKSNPRSRRINFRYFLMIDLLQKERNNSFAFSLFLKSGLTIKIKRLLVVDGNPNHQIDSSPINFQKNTMKSE